MQDKRALLMATATGLPASNFSASASETRPVEVSASPPKRPKHEEGMVDITMDSGLADSEAGLDTRKTKPRKARAANTSSQLQLQ
eukprot:8631268-Prorocentrum_lima.AAC.1